MPQDPATLLLRVNPRETCTPGSEQESALFLLFLVSKSRNSPNKYPSAGKQIQNSPFAQKTLLWDIEAGTATHPASRAPPRPAPSERSEEEKRIHPTQCQAGCANTQIGRTSRVLSGDPDGSKDLIIGEPAQCLPPEAERP